MRKTLRICIFCLCVIPLFAEWVMFSDNKDTYIYNNQTGEIYVRYKKGKKNYEDVFVKMPHGQNPQELIPSLKPTPPNDAKGEDLKMQSLKKTQELMNDALKGAF